MFSKMDLPYSEEELIELVRSTEGETKRFLSKDTLYYMRAYNRVKRGGVLFNFSAFFFGSLWLFYRKMYLFGFIYLFFMGFGFPISNLILGILGNHIYFYFLREEYLDGMRYVGTHPRWLFVLLPFLFPIILLLPFLIWGSFFKFFPWSMPFWKIYINTVSC